jgi:hypothetical protein
LKTNWLFVKSETQRMTEQFPFDVDLKDWMAEPDDEWLGRKPEQWSIDCQNNF